MYHAGDPIGYADLKESYWQEHLKVVAVYLDQDTKAVLAFTYDLVLKKTAEKWIIDLGI